MEACDSAHPRDSSSAVRRKSHRNESLSPPPQFVPQMPRKQVRPRVWRLFHLALLRNHQQVWSVDEVFFVANWFFTHHDFPLSRCSVTWKIVAANSRDLIWRYRKAGLFTSGSWTGSACRATGFWYKIFGVSCLKLTQKESQTKLSNKCTFGSIWFVSVFYKRSPHKRSVAVCELTQIK